MLERRRDTYPIPSLARRPAVTMPAASGATSLYVLPPMERLSLRVRQVGEADAVAGLPLDLPMNRATRAGGRSLLRLGPDEWLLRGPDGDDLAASVAAALSGRFHASVDVSHRNTGFSVEGAQAADVLNAGCPLDLSERAFPAGAATRTLLGKAEILLIRTGTGFEVECWRSFATYIRDFLVDAARTAR